MAYRLKFAGRAVREVGEAYGAQELLKIFQQSPVATVAVTGKSSGAATVEAALKRLAPLPANSQTVVLFVGDAAPSGIKLETLQIP